MADIQVWAANLSQLATQTRMIMQAMESGMISEDAARLYARATAQHGGDCPHVGLCHIAIA